MEIPDILKEKFSSARRVCVLTGAGISAESGVPTFRSSGSALVWKGMPFTEISSARMVREDLGEVWEWFDYRRNLLKECKPNPGHLALAAWQERFDEFTLVTQNIDNLHRTAGSREVIELHGNIWRARCESCGRLDDIVEKESGVPICRSCSERMRPDVVLFGEMLPVGAFDTAADRATKCDLFFIIGTSAVVYPAAALPETAARSGAFLVEVNPEEAPLTQYCDLSLRGNAGDVLPLFTDL